MLNFNSIMIGSENPKKLAEFWEQVLGKAEDSDGEKWFGWNLGEGYMMIGEHSKVKGMSPNPERIIINFLTNEVGDEFERIKKLGAEVIAEPYEMMGSDVATLADPEGNYFQLMSPMSS